MKKHVSIFVLVVIASIGLMAYDFDKNKSPVCEVAEGNASSAQLSASTDLFYTGLYENKNNSIKKNFNYSVRRKYNRSITKEELKQVAVVDEFFDEYPSSWIEEYTSVEIQAVEDGKDIWAMSPDNVLNSEQKEILNSLAIDEEYVVLIKFKSKNAVTNKLENRNIKISMSVIPEVEAEFIGGYDQLISYLEESCINKIAYSDIDISYLSTIQFTINEEGAIENAELIESSGNDLVDEMLLSSLNEMPKWIPAEDAEGNKVSQQFFFNSGMDGC